MSAYTVEQIAAWIVGAQRRREASWDDSRQRYTLGYADAVAQANCPQDAHGLVVLCASIGEVCDWAQGVVLEAHVARMERSAEQVGAAVGEMAEAVFSGLDLGRAI